MWGRLYGSMFSIVLGSLVLFIIKNSLISPFPTIVALHAVHYFTRSFEFQTLKVCHKDLFQSLFHLSSCLFQPLMLGSQFQLFMLFFHRLPLVIFLNSYDNKEIALHCGSMLRDCFKVPSFAKYILESPSFELFFKFVELPNFDVSSDAFSTFKDLLTKHASEVSDFLSAHYDEFFQQYEILLTSKNYVTRRQSLKLLSDVLLEPPNSHIMKRYITEVHHLKIMMTLLKDSSKNIQISAFHIFKVFVANPNKPREIKVILSKNHEKLLALLQDLCGGKGGEDEQLEEEKEMIMKEIERLSRLPGLES